MITRSLSSLTLKTSSVLFLSLTPFTALHAQSTELEASKQSPKDTATKLLTDEIKKAKSLRYERARQLHKQHAKVLKDLAEGKVRRFPNIVANWQNYLKQVKTLQADYQDFKTSDNAEKSAQLANSITNQIQSFGFLLKSATHQGYVSAELTEAQLKEEDRLMNEFNTLASSDDGSKFKLLTPGTFYTLKHIPMPIQFSAPPNTKIMLFSEVGGTFQNQLDYISITANEQGIATTTWVSHGDGVADCNIIYRSPEYPSKGFITPVVKRLELRSLESLSPVVKKATKQIPNKAENSQ